MMSEGRTVEPLSTALKALLSERGMTQTELWTAAGLTLEAQADEAKRAEYLRAVAGMTWREWQMLRPEHRRAVAGILVRVVTIQREEPRVRVQWS